MRSFSLLIQHPLGLLRPSIFFLKFCFETLHVSWRTVSVLHYPAWFLLCTLLCCNSSCNFTPHILPLSSSLENGLLSYYFFLHNVNTWFCYFLLHSWSAFHSPTHVSVFPLTEFELCMFLSICSLTLVVSRISQMQKDKAFLELFFLYSAHCHMLYINFPFLLFLYSFNFSFSHSCFWVIISYFHIFLFNISRFTLINL